MRLAKKIIRLTTLLVLVCFLTPSQAQLNSPFSRYGLGNEIWNNQNAASQGIGGFSTAFTPSMNGSYGQSINFSNPASYGNIYMTTFDLGLNYNQTTLKRVNPAGSEKSAYLIPNYLVIGIPISKVKKMGMAFGLQPISSIRYNVNEKVLLSSKDTLANNYQGEGGLNQFFIGFGREWKHVSVGFNTGYNFGRKNIETVKSVYDSTGANYFYQSKTSSKSHFGGLFVKLAMMGNATINSKENTTTKEKIEHTISYGATYTLDQSLSAKTDVTVANGSYSESISAPLDTINFSVDNAGTIKIPSVLSIGAAFHKKLIVAKGSFDQWVVGAEITQSAWKDKYTYYGKPDALNNSYMIRGGIQYNPDPFAFDSYWSTVVYRAGFFTGKDYVNIDNNGLKVIGFSFGLGMPIRKYRSYDYQYTIMNLALQLGQRGSSVNNFKENFIQFTLGYSLSDVWFNKRKYD